MDESRFETLLRAMHGGHSRRSALLTLLGSSLGLLPVLETAAKKKHKRKKRRHKDNNPSTGQTPTQTSPQCVECGTGCCDRASCFAEKVSDVDRRALSHACCPAAALCLSTTPTMPDQCCYPDETCDPTLPSRFPPGEIDTICCRTCGERCCASFEECQDGLCNPLTTARLPRTRRP